MMLMHVLGSSFDIGSRMRYEGASVQATGSRCGNKSEIQRKKMPILNRNRRSKGRKKL